MSVCDEGAWVKRGRTKKHRQPCVFGKLIEEWMKDRAWPLMSTDLNSEPVFFLKKQELIISFSEKNPFKP
jgi:hypothetical protein